MKKVKMILPALAFVFAIVAAFAGSSTNLVQTDAYRQNSGTPACTKLGKCTEIGEIQCISSAATGSVPLYKFNGSTCQVELNGESFVAN